MSGPRGMFMQSRWATVSFFALKIPLTGCGFALAFGWLWFPELRVLLVPGLIADGTISHPYASCLAFGAGCFFYGLLCRRLENNDARHRLLNVILAHAFPPLLLGLMPLTRGLGLSFPMLDGTLMGLAGALPGVWWTTRLLASEPGKAVASLAWAAFVSLVLTLPLSRIQMDGTVAVCVLTASLALACLTALFLVREEREGCGEEDTRPATAASLEAPYRFGPFRGIYAVFLCGIIPIFSALAL